MKWWGPMDGWYSRESGYTFNEGDIKNRRKYNLGDNVISDTEMRIIGGADNSASTFMFRGTSCIRPEVLEFWDMAAKVCASYEKIIWWGCGVGGRVPAEMPPSFYRAIESNSYWGVRGPMTESLLTSLGVPVERIFMTHCPTLLRGVIQGFDFKMKKPTDIKIVVVSTWTDKQPDWLLRIAERYKNNGARVIFHLQDNDEAWQAVHEGVVSERLKPLFDRYEVAMCKQPTELDFFLQEADLVLGLKLHCNLPALAWGTPAYTLTDDWRMKEILIPQGFPCISPYQNHKFTEYKESDFQYVTEAVTACAEANRRFLEAAGINYEKL